MNNLMQYIENIFNSLPSFFWYIRIVFVNFLKSLDKSPFEICSMLDIDPSWCRDFLVIFTIIVIVFFSPVIYKNIKSFYQQLIIIITSPTGICLISIFVLNWLIFYYYYNNILLFRFIAIGVVYMMRYYAKYKPHINGIWFIDNKAKREYIWFLNKSLYISIIFLFIVSSCFIFLISNYSHWQDVLNFLTCSESIVVYIIIKYIREHIFNVLYKVYNVSVIYLYDTYVNLKLNITKLCNIEISNKRRKVFSINNFVTRRVNKFIYLLFFEHKQNKIYYRNFIKPKYVHNLYNSRPPKVIPFKFYTTLRLSTLLSILAKKALNPYGTTLVDGIEVAYVDYISSNTRPVRHCVLFYKVNRIKFVYLDTGDRCCRYKDQTTLYNELPVNSNSSSTSKAIVKRPGYSVAPTNNPTPITENFNPSLTYSKAFHDFVTYKHELSQFNSVYADRIFEPISKPFPIPHMNNFIVMTATFDHNNNFMNSEDSEEQDSNSDIANITNELSSSQQDTIQSLDNTPWPFTVESKFNEHINHSMVKNIDFMVPLHILIWIDRRVAENDILGLIATYHSIVGSIPTTASSNKYDQFSDITGIITQQESNIEFLSHGLEMGIKRITGIRVYTDAIRMIKSIILSNSFATEKITNDDIVHILKNRNRDYTGRSLLLNKPFLNQEIHPVYLKQGWDYLLSEYKTINFRDAYIRVERDILSKIKPDEDKSILSNYRTKWEYLNSYPYWEPSPISGLISKCPEPYIMDNLLSITLAEIIMVRDILIERQDISKLIYTYKAMKYKKDANHYYKSKYETILTSEKLIEHDVNTVAFVQVAFLDGIKKLLHVNNTDKAINLYHNLLDANAEAEIPFDNKTLVLCITHWNKKDEIPDIFEKYLTKPVNDDLITTDRSNYIFRNTIWPTNTLFHKVDLYNNEANLKPRLDQLWNRLTAQI